MMPVLLCWIHWRDWEHKRALFGGVGAVGLGCLVKADFWIRITIHYNSLFNSWTLTILESMFFPLTSKASDQSQVEMEFTSKAHWSSCDTWKLSDWRCWSWDRIINLSDGGSVSTVSVGRVPGKRKNLHHLFILVFYFNTSKFQQ